MKPLYEITATIESLLERAIGEGGEILDEQLDAELDALEADRDKRALHIAAAIVDFEAEAEKIAERAKVLREWAASLDAKAERLTLYIAAHVPAGHKIADDRCRISWRRSEACIVDVSPEDLPLSWQKLTYSARVAEIKDALKAGDPEAAKVAHLEARNSVQVR